MLSIEGIISGTLSFIFNSFKPGMAFSDVGCIMGFASVFCAYDAAVLEISTGWKTHKGMAAKWRVGGHKGLVLVV
jgi:hypothetical protein